MSATDSFLEISPGRVSGRVRPAAAKNSILKCLAASLLTDDPVVLTRFPAGLLDVQVHVGMLQKLGKRCERSADSLLIVKQSPLPERLDWDGRSIRNTLLILGALLARNGTAEVPLPGGCKLGERTFDIHVDVIRALGGEVRETNRGLRADAAGGLKGTDVRLRLRSTGATENAILMGCLAKGTTTVWNPHIRPEILDVVSMLRKMGAQITVFGQERIEIVGVPTLRGTTHGAIVDGMEAITWVVAAAITDGEVEILDFPFQDLEIAMIHLEAAGVRTFRRDDALLVRPGHRYPIEVSTGPHPGINSDAQPILAAFAACAAGESRIVDLRFPGRYAYAEQLSQLGAKVAISDNLLRIEGSRASLEGTEVTALDLRAGACLALCGLVARGRTRICDAWQISRGYEAFAEKLRSLGIDVKEAP